MRPLVSYYTRMRFYSFRVFILWFFMFIATFYFCFTVVLFLTSNIFKYEVCVKSFMNKDILSRHAKIHSGIQFTYSVWLMVYTRKDKFTRHEK
jgi:hypothetical protein